MLSKITYACTVTGSMSTCTQRPLIACRLSAGLHAFCHVNPGTETTRHNRPQKAAILPSQAISCDSADTFPIPLLQADHLGRWLARSHGPGAHHSCGRLQLQHCTAGRNALPAGQEKHSLGDKSGAPAVKPICPHDILSYLLDGKGRIQAELIQSMSNFVLFPAAVCSRCFFWQVGWKASTSIFLW